MACRPATPAPMTSTRLGAADDTHPSGPISLIGQVGGCTGARLDADLEPSRDQFGGGVRDQGDAALVRRGLFGGRNLHKQWECSGTPKPPSATHDPRKLIDPPYPQ